MRIQITTLAVALTLSLNSLAQETSTTEAPPKEFPELIVQTPKGPKTYTKVKVIRHDAAALQIMHSAGMARVLLADVPEDVQVAYRYTRSAAERAEQQYAQQVQEINKLQASRAAALASAQQSPEERESYLKTVAKKASKTPTTFRVLSPDEAGLLIQEIPTKEKSKAARPVFLKTSRRLAYGTTLSIHHMKVSGKHSYTGPDGEKESASIIQEIPLLDIQAAKMLDK